MSKVTLDAETFRALASSTRLGVLRALDERRKTLSELARGMDLNKATLHEHLQLLSAADLVRKRDDEGRKWIYYELTWRGQRLLHPQETTTFNVLLGMGVAAAGGGTLMLGKALGWWLQERSLELQSSQEDAGIAAGAPAQDAMSYSTASSASSSSPPASPQATGTASSPAAGMQEAAGADSTQKSLDDSQAAGDGDVFGDNGWIGVALLACTVLFGFLAYRMHKKLRPGKFVPPAAGED